MKDLCGRLPYGVKVSVNQSQLQNYNNKWKSWCFDEGPQEIYGVSIHGVTFGCLDTSDGDIDFEYIKPYLFPLSNMPEEQKVIHGDLCYKVIYNSKGLINSDVMEYVNWCYKNHIDINNLIPKRLAWDATNLNIY